MNTKRTYLPRTVAAQISSTLEAMENCRKSGNALWLGKHRETLERLRHHLPSGSGFDNGCGIEEVADAAASVFKINTSYHHMNDGGMYDGWTDHTITVRATFDGPSIAISGRNRNDVKDYMAEVFHHALTHTLTLAEWLAAHGCSDQLELYTEE